ncbi:MAG: hypothetical protein KDI87_04350 [Gammaproteobacteria bacterium]|nr:hypothetical protein [Gammaproteobacteria bacterium]
MSDKENEQTAFRNADTLHRRAWIDRALSGVRGRLHPDDEGDLVAAAPPPVTGPETIPAARPRLYVVRNRASR